MGNRKSDLGTPKPDIVTRKSKKWGDLEKFIHTPPLWENSAGPCTFTNPIQQRAA